MYVLIGTKAGVNYPKQGDSEVVKLADVARWNEFGTELSPPRPAFRVGTENAVKNSKDLIKNYLRELVNPKMTPQTLKQMEKTFMANIATRCEKAVKKIIKDGSTSPNAPSTIAKKGFNHPLKETELLYKNVKAVVVK